MAATDENVTSQAEEPEEVPFALRAIVVLLGVGIIVMLALIGYTMYQKFVGPAEGESGSAQVAQPTDISAQTPAAVSPQMSATNPQWSDYSITDKATASPTVVPGQVAFTVPQGAVLAQKDERGAMLKLHYRLKSGGDIFIYLDRTTGQSQVVRVGVEEAP